jgi:hypothetical protein
MILGTFHVQGKTAGAQGQRSEYRVSDSEYRAKKGKETRLAASLDVSCVMCQCQPRVPKSAMLSERSRPRKNRAETMTSGVRRS